MCPKGSVVTSKRKMKKQILPLTKTRPVVFIKVVTTSLRREAARVIEMSMQKHYPDGSVVEHTRRLKPDVQIDNSEYHGIKDSDVKGCLEFRDIMDRLTNFVKGCDLVGFNLEYDLEVLTNEYERNFNSHIPFEFNYRNRIDLMQVYRNQNDIEFGKHHECYKFYTGKRIYSSKLTSMQYIDSNVEIADEMMNYFGISDISQLKSI